MSTPARIAPAAPTPAAHLLLVDDEELNRDMLSRRLARHGYDVATATSGSEALALLDQTAVDVVLLDMQMPGMSGMEVLQTIRTSQRHARLPVIMLTARTQSEDVVTALDAGASDYVTKPVDLAVALARIRTQVARKRDEARLVESEARYALAIQGSNDGLWDWRLADDTAYFSSRCEAILGVSAGGGSGTIEDWFARVHPDDLGRLRAALAAHLDGVSTPFEHEHRLCTSPGQVRWVLARGQTARDASGTPIRVAGSLTDITEGRTADALTGLPNRVLFLDRLAWRVERAVAEPERAFAVLFIDLDRFTDVNDVLGHDVGDALLVKAAQRLSAALRHDGAPVDAARSSMGSPDVLARFGGDAFAVLLDNLRAGDEALMVATRLVTAMNSPFVVGDHELFATISVGVAIHTAGSRAEDLLRDADTALARAKATGRSRCEVFDADMRARVVERVTLEADLRRALDRGQFTLVYQPIVALHDRSVTGMETLLRWDHPERGRLAPLDFLSTAEDTGLIVPIGWWILDAVCRQVHTWEASGALDERFTVAINVSMRQLQERDFAARVGEIVARHGIAPRRLEFELTESVMMTQPEMVSGVVRDLKTMGHRISLDDFGTGYSSLSYLRHLPVDRLKIDRAFLTDATTPDWESHGIIDAMVTLARYLRADVVAEGVETSAQFARVRALGCGFGQGFYFAHPMPPRQGADLLKLERPGADTGR